MIPDRKSGKTEKQENYMTKSKWRLKTIVIILLGFKYVDYNEWY